MCTCIYVHRLFTCISLTRNLIALRNELQVFLYYFSVALEWGQKYACCLSYLGCIRWRPSFKPVRNDLYTPTIFDDGDKLHCCLSGLVKRCMLKNTKQNVYACFFWKIWIPKTVNVHTFMHLFLIVIMYFQKKNIKIIFCIW